MVLVHFAEGFEEVEALATVDVLRRAGIETRMVSTTGILRVNGAHQIPVITDMLFKDAPYEVAEMILLPGGMPGTLNLDNHDGLKEQVINFAQNKKLAAICAAPRIPGKLGLLKGKKAVCYPGNDEFLEGAVVLDVPAITDGNITTGRGAGPVFDFALEVVRVLKGEEVAAEVAKKMLIK